MPSQEKKALWILNSWKKNQRKAPDFKDICTYDINVEKKCQNTVKQPFIDCD